ncbi:hypothetical protein GII33_20745 [Gordonia pseudamarae]|jgi:hypothetical protein|uniref:hypothetical protein n=1 Tax=Gordonia TaxID=2053 RepID=UPI00198866F5|nr:MULTISPECIES: hypothetical protein [Gordonia]MBD0021934.1 hypothetical protein [Gordonia sp. (in: high G+C Gram-positive bacteria)]QHN28039.1 hypothetical protein GII33_20745 [Gordonia pseudamarae]
MSNHDGDYDTSISDDENHRLTADDVRDYWSTDHTKFTYLDWWETEELDDVGAPGKLAAAYTEPDGTRSYWIVEDALRGVRVDNPMPDGWPAHERLGPLPPAVTARLNQPPTCGRPTAKGRPCRLHVDHPGRACTIHQSRETRP